MSEWMGIAVAPQNGTRFIGRRRHIERYTGKMRYQTRITWWGKTSHVPLYGWCHGRVEDVDLWEPQIWKPLTPKPSGEPNV